MNNLLETGRLNLEGALNASDQATQLANQLQAARANMTMANRSAKAQAQGQMAGSLGALGIAAYPQISSYLSGAGKAASLGAPGNAAAVSTITPEMSTLASGAPATSLSGTVGGLSGSGSGLSGAGMGAIGSSGTGTLGASGTAAATESLTPELASLAPDATVAGGEALGEGALATGGEAAGETGLMASMPELGALGPIGLGIGAAAAIAGLCGLFN